RGPTWPDPGADNGWQRQRLALMPCPEGWRLAGVPGQARRLREPLWCHPVSPGGNPGPALPALGPDLALVSLRQIGDGSGDLVLAVQNEGPCRRCLDPGVHWRLAARLDGLDRPWSSSPPAALASGVGGLDRPGLDGLLAPWQLGFWRLSPL
ncbi:MAG: alpha-mannosidase, partial [Cyanobium sp. ELA507]